jgi:hypothetical protein
MKPTGAFLLAIFINVFCFGQDSIYMTGPTKFTDWIGTANNYSVAALAADKFVVAYNEGGVWEGNVRIGTLIDTVISFGNSFTYASGTDLQYVEVTKLSATRFFLTYKSNTLTKIRACKVINGNQIQFGSSFTFMTGFFQVFSQAALSDDTFIIAYHDPDTDHGKCALGKINTGLGISIDSTYTFTTSTLSNSTYLSTDTLSDSKFVITYADSQGRSIIGTVDDNDEISFGNSFMFNSAETYQLDVIGLNVDNFFIVFSDGYNYWKGTVVLGTTNENNSITFTDKYYFNEQMTRENTATKLTGNEVIIGFNDSYVDYSGYLLKATIDNNNVSFSEWVKCNDNATSNYQNSLSSLTNQWFIVMYADGDSFNGYTRLCSTIDFVLMGLPADTWKGTINIYPNPANSILSINCSEWISESCKIELFNQSGKELSVLFEGKINRETLEFNISEFPTGIYLCRITFEGRQTTKKVVIR